MQNLIGPYYIKSYNPVHNVNSENNAFSEIKSMLISRNVEMQTKATRFLIEAIIRFAAQSTQRQKVIEHILSNDIVVFLCEAMATDHWPVLRIIISCFKMLAQSPTFYTENYAPYATSSIIRTVYFNLKDDKNDQMIEFCLNFVSEIFYSVRFHKLTPAISQSSLYNVEQLFDFLLILIEQPIINNKTKLAISLVLHAIISHQPEDLRVDIKRVQIYSTVIERWLPEVCNTLKKVQCMMKDDGKSDLVYGIICHLGMDSLRLCGFLKSYKREKTFIEKEILQKDDTLLLIQLSKRIAKTVYGAMIELVSYTKSHRGCINLKSILTEVVRNDSRRRFQNCSEVIEDFHDEINDNEYELFLKFLYLYFQSVVNQSLLPVFSEHLAETGYLTLLPRTNFLRNKSRLNELCTVNLSEILTHLSRRYLEVNQWPGGEFNFVKDMKKGLKALSQDMELWPSILDSKSNNECTTKPFSLLVFLYFHCLSSQSPQICSAPFLPFLVKHIMELPRYYKPPPPVVKCLWLVFAMSSISNTEWSSLEERILLERAIGKFINVISVDTDKIYTHHPALVLWVFSSDRIVTSVQCVTLTQWLRMETTLPAGLSTFPVVWRTLVSIVQDRFSPEIVLDNATLVLKQCMDEADEASTNEVGDIIWEHLGDMLSVLLVNEADDSAVNHAKYILDLASFVIPSNMPVAAYQRSAVLLAAVLTRQIYLSTARVDENFCYQCLRLSFCLVNVAIEKDDTSVLQIFVSRIGFIQCVLRATQSLDEELSCTALRLLSYIVHFYGKYNVKGNKVIELDPSALLSVLWKEKKSSICQAFLQLLHTILSNSSVTKTNLINLSTRVSDRQCVKAFRGIMFRLQMISCRESKEESANGMQTLNSLLKFAADGREDSGLIISLVSQPWCHALVRFHLQQGNFTSFFLQFLKNWLICLKIIRKDKKKIIVSKQQSTISVLNRNSIFLKTFVHIERVLNRSDVTSQLCDSKEEIRVMILNTISEFIEMQ